MAGTNQLEDHCLIIKGLCVSSETTVPSSMLLRDVCLNLRRGEIIGLMGESGSGKTTLIRAALGLLSSGLVASGMIRLLGVDVIGRVSEHEIRKARKKTAFISQNPYAGFAPDVPVGVQLSFLAASRRLKDGAVESAEQLLQKLGVKQPMKALQAAPGRLSGGQLQRLQLAMALLVRPEIIFADEIIASLDPNNAKRVARVLLEHHEEHGTTILLASHDAWLIEMLCDRWYQVSNQTLEPQ